jgi:fibronectin type 3 domain-containing protein
MKKILLTILLLISTAVLAEPLIMQTATQRVDGRSLGLSEISGHNIYCGTTSGTYGDANFVAGAALPDTIIDTVPGVVVGTNYCVVTTVDISGLESDYSANEVQVIVSLPRPKPPTITEGMIINTTL